MYGELVKRLRRCSQFRCRGCEYENITPCRTKLNDEAADAIEELSKPRWIPVTERLPDYPGRFMCYYEIDDCGEMGHCIDWGRYNPDDGWYVSGVTRWQSLPEPPREEK